MRRIVETSLMLVAVIVFVFVFVAMRVVPVRVAMLIVMLLMLMTVIVRMLALVFMFMFVRHLSIPLFTFAFLNWFFRVSCVEVFTTEAQSSPSSEYLLIKNSLLRVLRASAVQLPNSGSV